METKKPGWEGLLLLFGMLFTTLSISAYSLGVALGFAPVFRQGWPWVAMLAVSVAAVVATRYRGVRG